LSLNSCNLFFLWPNFLYPPAGPTRARMVLRLMNMVLIPGLFFAIALQVFRILRYQRAVRAGIYVGLTPRGISYRTELTTGLLLWGNIQRIELSAIRSDVVVMKEDFADSQACRSFRKAGVGFVLRRADHVEFD